MLNQPNVPVIPNGVDLDRFTPEIERPGQRLLFIGSFRHFPNIVAYRFFAEQVWPLLRAAMPGLTFTVVAGPDPAALLARAHRARSRSLHDDRIRLLEFVSDVRPLYVEANLALVPTLVSAGTNLKVLEAMAMERAVVSTSSGCAGLGLEHSAQRLDRRPGGRFRASHPDPARRPRPAPRDRRVGRVHVERHFGWKAHRRAPASPASGVDARAACASGAAGETDLPANHRHSADGSGILAMASPGLSGLRLPGRVLDGRIAGFLVSRSRGR